MRGASTVLGGVCADLPQKCGKAALSYSTLLAMRTLLLLTGTAICMLLEGWQLFRNEAAKNEICADLPGQFMDM